MIEYTITKDKLASNGLVEKDLTGVYTLVKSAVSTGYSYLSAVTINDEIYIYGGLHNGAPSGRLIKYNPTTGVVTTLASGVARYQAGVCAYNNKLYVFGGYNGSAALTTASVYNPATNQWSTLTALPQAVYATSVFVENGLIYIVSGYNGSTITQRIMVYDPVANNYTSSTIPDSHHRDYAGGDGQYNGIFYLMGGMQNPAGTTSYDPVTKTWTPTPSLPANRSYANAVVLNGKMYFFGGFDAPNRTAQSSLYKRDLSNINNPWTTTHAPFTSVASPLVKCHAKVYWIGVDIYRFT